VLIARENKNEMEKRMNRHVSLASLLLASTFAIHGSAAFAAQVQRTQHTPPSPANVVKSTSNTAHRTDQKTTQPQQALRLPPKFFPPGPSGHDASPSSRFGD
jgi:hypothetical protein